MRQDMFKVIVERERRGGGRERKGRKKDFDDLPKKEGMRRAHADRKSLNENLAPLKRFLNKAVGRPWNNVFSEICEHINVNSTVQQHVRQHIFDFVHNKDIRIEDSGKVTYRLRYGGAYIELWHGSLYVHPRTGILCKYQRKDRKTWRSQWKYTPPTLATVISSLIEKRGAKGKTVEQDGVYYKVYQNPVTKAWDVFNVANATHARVDFNNHFGFWSIWYDKSRGDADYVFKAFRKTFESTKNDYLKTLWKLYCEGVEYKRQQKEKADKKKKDEEAKKSWKKDCHHFGNPFEKRKK